MPSQNQLPRRVTGAFQSGALSWGKRKSEWGGKKNLLQGLRRRGGREHLQHRETDVWTPDDWKQGAPRLPEEPELLFWAQGEEGRVRK